jgi:hypothetical protein
MIVALLIIGYVFVGLIVLLVIHSQTPLDSFKYGDIFRFYVHLIVWPITVLIIFLICFARVVLFAFDWMLYDKKKGLK